MFIEKEAYLQEHNRRELNQALEAKRLEKLAQNFCLQSRISFSHRISRKFQVLNDRVRAFVGTLKVA